MGKNRRVVVTGMGAITPIGNSVEEFWNGIKEGKTGFGPITYFDTADYRCKLAAEVKDFDPAQYMDKKSARRMEQFCQFAVAAAGQAISDAGLTMEQEDPYMVGCSVGSGIGSLQAMEREYDRLKEKGPGRVGPHAGASDDLQYGSRQCQYCLWAEGQEPECGYCLRNRYTFHRRSIPYDPVR